MKNHTLERTATNLDLGYRYGSMSRRAGPVSNFVFKA